MTEKVNVARKLNIYLDYESAVKALAEAREQLEGLNKGLKNLQVKYEDLVMKHDTLLSKYVSAKQDAIDCTWGYAVDNSDDFEEIGAVDTRVVETDRRAGPFYLGDVLGIGHYSIVKAISMEDNRQRSRPRARNGKGKDKMAAKIVNKENVTSIQGILSLENEIRALKEVTPHRNVVEFLGVIHGPQNLYILMEAFKYDLYNFMEDYKSKIDTNSTGLIIKEIMSGVAHLAQHNIIHRDIKPENILVHVATNDIEVKLCDFGLSKKLMNGATQLARSDFAGSPGFFAPELVVSSTCDAFKTDLFSVAAVALEMLTSVDFFTHTWMTPYELLKDPVEKGNFYFSMRDTLQKAQDVMQAKFADGPNSAVYAFMSGVLRIQPSLRPSATHLLRSAWMTKLEKDRAIDILLDRDRVHLHTRRFSYIPTPIKKLTRETDDDNGDFGSSSSSSSKKTILPKGVKIPLNKLPTISTQARQLVSIKTVANTDSSSSSMGGGRDSNVNMKDNGLGMAAVSESERARIAQHRRSSFLMVEAERRNSVTTQFSVSTLTAQLSSSSSSSSLAVGDPSHVSVSSKSMLTSLLEENQQQQQQGAEVVTTKGAAAPSSIAASAVQASPSFSIEPILSSNSSSKMNEGGEENTVLAGATPAARRSSRSMQQQPTVLKGTNDARPTAPAVATSAAVDPDVATTGEEVLQFDMEFSKHDDHHDSHSHHHHHRRRLDIDDENGDTDVEEVSPPASAAISRKPSFCGKSQS